MKDKEEGKRSMLERRVSKISNVGREMVPKNKE